MFFRWAATPDEFGQTYFVDTSAGSGNPGSQYHEVNGERIMPTRTEEDLILMKDQGLPSPFPPDPFLNSRVKIFLGDFSSLEIDVVCWDFSYESMMKGPGNRYWISAFLVFSVCRRASQAWPTINLQVTSLRVFAFTLPRAVTWCSRNQKFHVCHLKLFGNFCS